MLLGRQVLISTLQIRFILTEFQPFLLISKKILVDFKLDDMPQNNSDIPFMSLHEFSLKACQTNWQFYCRKDWKFSSEKRRDAVTAAPTCHVWSEVKGGAKCEEVMIPPKMFVNERVRCFSWWHCIWKADHLNLMDVSFILPSVLFRVLKVDHSLFRPFDNWNNA